MKRLWEIVKRKKRASPAGFGLRHLLIFYLFSIFHFAKCPSDYRRNKQAGPAPLQKIEP